VKSFFRELFQVGLYKWNQGRITRQVTWGALAAGAVLGFWRLNQFMVQPPRLLAWLAPGDSWMVVNSVFCSVMAILSCWVAYRLINFPRFADFLIAVEAEMSKVSWPTRAELFRSSVVVLVCIIVLAAILAVYDMVWYGMFWRLGILH
jgi:preprotein translocase subunit SecE